MRDLSRRPAISRGRLRRRHSSFRRRAGEPHASDRYLVRPRSRASTSGGSGACLSGPSVISPLRCSGDRAAGWRWIRWPSIGIAARAWCGSLPAPALVHQPAVRAPQRIRQPAGIRLDRNQVRLFPMCEQLPPWDLVLAESTPWSSASARRNVPLRPPRSLTGTAAYALSIQGGMLLTLRRARRVIRARLTRVVRPRPWRLWHRPLKQRVLGGAHPFEETVAHFAEDLLAGGVA